MFLFSGDEHEIVIDCDATVAQAVAIITSQVRVLHGEICFACLLMHIQNALTSIATRGLCSSFPLSPRLFLDVVVGFGLFRSRLPVAFGKQRQKITLHEIRARTQGIITCVV